MGDAGQIRFRGRVRWWDESSGAGISVIDVPADLVTVLGGRRQYRVSGTLAGAAFSGSGMLVAGGGYCIGLSKAALTAAGASIGDEVDVVISRA
jgi:uncharacterized protein DUF1905